MAAKNPKHETNCRWSGCAHKPLYHIQESVVIRRGCHVHVIQAYQCLATAAAQAVSLAGMVGQALPHDFGGDAKEVLLAGPGVLLLLFRRPDQPHPRIMNEDGGLKRMIGALVLHQAGGDVPQFFVNELQNLVGSLGVAGLHLFNKRVASLMSQW